MFDFATGKRKQASWKHWAYVSNSPVSLQLGRGVRALWSVASSVPIERPEHSQPSSHLHDLPLLLPANMRLFLPAPNTRNCLFFVSAPHDAFNRVMGRADCVPKR